MLKRMTDIDVYLKTVYILMPSYYVCIPSRYKVNKSDIYQIDI